MHCLPSNTSFLPPTSTYLYDVTFSFYGFLFPKLSSVLLRMPSGAPYRRPA